MRKKITQRGWGILQQLELAQLQYGKSEVRGLGEKQFDLLHLHPQQILMEHADVQAVGLAYQLCRLLPVVVEVHVGPLPLIFTSLAIQCIINELVEIFFHFVLRRGTHGGIH